jgi:hypothetical protein
MAQLRTRFETANVAPAQSRELLLPGKYNVQIVASEWKDTSTGGQMLVLEMDIVDGPASGRKMWDRLNLENANPKAVEIAEETLRDICLAQGKIGCDDSEELHFIPMTATVKVRPAGPDKKGIFREASNEIGNYKALEGAAAPARHTPAAAARPAAVAAPARAASPPPAANAPAAAPWRRQAS